MADLTSTNRPLFMRKHERDKLVAQCNIASREIRVIELQEEILRNEADIQAQLKVMEEADKNIKLQLAEIDKDNAKHTQA